MEKLGRVADDLFELVLDLDPARTSWERISADAVKRARALAAEARALKGELNQALAERRLGQALAAASARLSELADSLKDGGEAAWRSHYTNLAKSYEELVRAAVEAKVATLGRFRRLSPANHSRSLFHALSGLGAAAIYHWMISREQALWIMATCVVVFSGLELWRWRSPKANDFLMRSPMIRRIARAHEYYRVNSATFYAWGLLFAVAFCTQASVEAGCLVLAFGDPFASYLGRRFGRRKIFRDKSWVGALAFSVAAFLAVVVFQLVAYPEWPWSQRVLIAAIAALAGAVAEVFTFRLDDNFTVPLTAAIAVTLFG